ncbi:Phosphate-binding protein PstS precursor [Planctomycetes bacterium Pan216]|uniref:Phosphate-binding protein n=1 Tax=Kolteria novifilia TaxID=2527975 RepID=A0A518B4W3_9BACT|nr:Phosphate-binding protein PstS precursor [Planctomycetes bacterium Pan216]
MFRLKCLAASLALAALVLVPTSCQMGAGGTPLQGAGGTFPAPLYQRWFIEYHRLHPDVTVNYQATGSGAGIQQFTQGLVNFGASDAAMTDEEIAKVKQGVQLLPMTAGCVVVSYNIPSLKEPLKLSRDALAGIYLGEITDWADERIKKDNPDAALPSDLKVTVVHRAGGSGTTFCFTNHLSSISEKWKSDCGVGQTVAWPAGVGAKGNAGIAALITQTTGAVGYLEFGYAKQGGIPMATLENKAGEFVVPSLKSGQAALANTSLPENLRAFIPDPEGKGSYPIVTYTWLLCYKKYNDPKIAKALKDVIKYGLHQGQEDAEPLGYIPLPASVVETVEKAAMSIQP